MSDSPTFVRLEYLTPTGWELGHSGINLMNPARYVERLAERGKFGRATELSDDLQPTGTVWEPKDLPADPSVLVPSTTRIPQLPGAQADGTCPHCEETHDAPFDGGCLL